MSVNKQSFKPIDFSQGVYINADKVESWKMHYSITIDGTDFDLTESQYKTVSSMYGDTIREGKELGRAEVIKSLENYMHWAREFMAGRPQEIWLPMAELISALDKRIALIKGEK